MHAMCHLSVTHSDWVGGTLPYELLSNGSTSDKARAYGCAASCRVSGAERLVLIQIITIHEPVH